MIPELKIFTSPRLIFRLNSIKKRIYTKICNLNCSYFKYDGPISYESILLNKNKFTPINKGQIWGKAYDWAIFHIYGKIPGKYINNNLYVFFDFDGEAVYLDENLKPYFSINSKMSFMDYFQFSWNLRTKKVSEKEKENGFINCFLDASFNGKLIQPFGKARFKNAFVADCNNLLKEFYFDYLYFSYLYCSLEKEDLKEKLKEILDKSYNLLKKSRFKDIERARSYLTMAYSIDKNKPSQEIYAIGQAHLDMAWLWPIKETKRKSLRTYINFLNLIEKYPFYIFGTSQPQQLDWIKNLYPDIYEKIKGNILKGNIELQGGMWVEADCNLPDGESLVRQIIYGKKFYKKEFDIEVQTCWLVDAFGYPASLPQILKKAGLSYFCTIKLFWNQFNKFPHTTFLWEGIDGSKVLTHMPPEGTYTSEATCCSIKQAEKQFKEKNLIKSFLLVFGNGDGGGGPQEAHLELLDRFKNTEFNPQLSFAKAVDFFKKIEKDIDKLPIYKGELYLEKHQGTYTTQSNNKYFNRRMEIKLHNLETLSTFAYLNGYDYPSFFIEKVYKEILLYQFHDILPGSSVKEVYDETNLRYKTLMQDCDKKLTEIIGFISSIGNKNKNLTESLKNVDNTYNDNTYDDREKDYSNEIDKKKVNINKIENKIENEKDNKKGNNQENNEIKDIYGLNLTGFARKEYLKYEGRWFYAELQPYSADRLTNLDEIFNKNQEKTDNYGFSINKSDAKDNWNIKLSYGNDFIENDLVLLKFANDGSINFFLDKKNNKQLSGKYLNRLILFKDKWLYYNAWDIDFNYRKKSKKILKQINSINFLDGPKVIRRNFYRHKKTRITVDTILTLKSNLVEFSVDIDFHEKFKMLRVEFNPSFFSNQVNCEIQFGIIKRSTLNDTPINKAQFEICAHKFVDISDKDYGIALINDSKYGHYVKEGIISLNLLRSPIYPDKTADRGKHHFRYALYPHVNNFENSDVAKMGILFNNEIILTTEKICFEPICKVLAKDDNCSNIVIDTIKKAEEKDGIIIRLYESSGLRTIAQLKTSFQFKNAYEVDLLENIIMKINIDQISFSPFEIKTIYFETDSL